MDVRYIWLPEVSNKLSALTGVRPGPKYRQIYNLILDGRLQAEKVGGRYRIQEAQLSEIAELVGIPVAA